MATSEADSLSMQDARSAVSMDASTVCSLFAGKKGGASQAKGDDKGKWADRRKELGKMHTAIAQNPAAKRKYDAINALPGRGAGKTMKLQEMFKKLKDGPCLEDPYWQVEISQEVKERLKERCTWVLRERVDVMLGGRDKCQRAIDAGYYDSRKVKTPSGSVEEVRYVEGIEEEISTSTAQCAFTGQKKLTQEEATKKLKELTTNAKLMKKHAGLNLWTMPTQHPPVRGNRMS